MTFRQGLVMGGCNCLTVWVSLYAAAIVLPPRSRQGRLLLHMPSRSREGRLLLDMPSRSREGRLLLDMPSRSREGRLLLDMHPEELIRKLINS